MSTEVVDTSPRGLQLGQAIRQESIVGILRHELLKALVDTYVESYALNLGSRGLLVITGKAGDPAAAGVLGYLFDFPLGFTVAAGATEVAALCASMRRR